MLARKSPGIDGEERYFNHPFIMTFLAMMGNALCMVVYQFKQRVLNRGVEEEHKMVKMRPVLLLPPALMDWIATYLLSLGLVLTRDAGTYEIVKASTMVWCALLAIPVMRRWLRWYQWLGILLVSVGVFVKASIMIPAIFPEYQKHEYCEDYLNITEPEETIAALEDILVFPDTHSHDFHHDAAHDHEHELAHRHGLVHVHDSDIDGVIDVFYGSSTKEEDELRKTAIGYAFILVGNFLLSCKDVYQEKILKNYNEPPLKVLGLQGTWSISTMAVVVVPLYFVNIADESLGTGPDSRLVDPMDGFHQIFCGCPWLLAWAICYCTSGGVYCASNAIIAKMLSSSTTQILKNVISIFIWCFFLLPFGPFLCNVQGQYHYTAVISLSVVILGVTIYKDIIILPTIRKLLGMRSGEVNDDSGSEVTATSSNNSRSSSSSSINIDSDKKLQNL